MRLDEVVLRALEKEPEHRYQQASAMKTQVETIAMTEHPSGAAPPSPDQPTPAENGIAQKLARLPKAPAAGPNQQAARIQAVERNVLLPLRALLLAVLGYYFFMGRWSEVPNEPRGIALSLLQKFFWFYLAANIAAGVAFIRVRHISLKTTQRIIVAVGILDIFLITALTFIMDGFDSPLFPVFAVLILHNALSIPRARPQLLLNSLAALGFIVGGVLDKLLISGNSINKESITNGVDFLGRLIHIPLEAGNPSTELRTENPFERILVLVIWAACCYFIQALFEKQKRAVPQTPA